MNKSKLFIFSLIFINLSIVVSSLGVNIPNKNTGSGTGTTYITNQYINQTNNITTYIVNQTNITNNITNNITTYQNTSELDTIALTSISNQNSSWRTTFNISYSIYAYNQTTPFTNWLTSFLYNYNQSSIFSYNHTQASNNSIVNTYGKWFYNMTTSGNSSFNESRTNDLYYPLSNPNSYLTYLDTITQSESSYQLNDGAISFNNDGNNNWLSDGGLIMPDYLFGTDVQGKLGYNFSSNTPMFYNGSSWINFNKSTGGSATPNDGITLKYQNITNVPSCTSGQFLTNTSGLACATPSGSGGTIYVPTGQPILVRQLNQLSTNNNTLWSDTDLKFDIYGGNNYTMVCDIMFRSDIATTGMSINLSSNFSSSNVNIAYNTWSSATAPVGFSATAFNTAFIGTGSGATIIRPNLLIADFTATSTGAVIVKMRSEISGSNAIIDRGSKCELYNRTAYQLTPVSNVTGIYPATAYQYRDLVTTNVTAWNQTSLNFSLDNAKTYNLVCDILFTGAAATTGQAINLTSTATTSNVNIMYNTWSSATANVGFSATAFQTALIGTGSGGTIILPNLIIADFTTTSTGILSLTFRSEVGASASTMKRGSTCRLYDMT